MRTFPLETLGEHLHRPESVCVMTDGRVVVPNWSGGVSVVDRDGRTGVYLAKGSPIDLRPNGVAFSPDGDLLLANLGRDGGVWRFSAQGELLPVLTEFEGRPLPPTNFALVDSEGRTWVSISTHLVPRQLAWRPHVSDGFVVVIDQGRPRIAVEGLHYTNEVRPDPAGKWLYVVETFGQRLVRFEILGGSKLAAGQLVVQFDSRFFPDGFAFDQEGAIWVTSLISNRVAKVHPDGRVRDEIGEVNESFVSDAVASFADGCMEARHLGPIPEVRFQHLTSIAFGGDDGRTAYLGSLHGTCVHTFRVDVPGVPAPFADAARNWPLNDEASNSA